MSPARLSQHVASVIPASDLVPCLTGETIVLAAAIIERANMRPALQSRYYMLHTHVLQVCTPLHAKNTCTATSNTPPPMYVLSLDPRALTCVDILTARAERRSRPANWDKGREKPVICMFQSGTNIFLTSYSQK